MARLLSWLLIVTVIVQTGHALYGPLPSSSSKTLIKSTRLASSSSTSPHTLTTKKSTTTKKSSIKTVTTSTRMSTTTKHSKSTKVKSTRAVSTASIGIVTTRRTSSSSVPFPQTGSPPVGCPSVSTSIHYTTTSLVYIQTDTDTLTTDTTVQEATITETVIFSTTLTFASYIYTSTSYFSGNPGRPPATITIFASPTDQVTIFKPTSAGFTPILCEAPWVEPIVIITEYTSTAYQGNFPVYSSTETIPGTYTSTIYENAPQQTTSVTISTVLTTAFYITVTSTRDQPTSTVYDACTRGSNYAIKPPANLQPVLSGINYDESMVKLGYVDALSQVDCCNICQGNSSCIGSAASRSYETNVGCTLFLRADATGPTCSTAEPAIIFQTSFEDVIVKFNYSNGACGGNFGITGF